ncbi:ornithine cyclodeaminase [Streptomyces massasporeus]|uniref:ornithine cyclodeaminase n=1 Tax=Streptomyces massasporeus TaxID=67324 RepID=UPI001679AD33|nr:ornithine cyclodeaminase [Streptomyces massasporeus]GGV90910.1 ornithine cyclodeaminase [Streptomyces massasporeus]
MSRQPMSDLFYLTRADVAQALSHIDPVAVAADVLRAHARGETVVPDEGYLGWTTADGHSARSLNMPGLVGGQEPVVGTKIINASLGNTARGIPRADGLTFLFDPETAHPYAMMDAALISATRTAAVSAVAVGLRTRPVLRLAFLGCGAQADAHLGLLLPRLGDLTELALYDQQPVAAAAFAEKHRAAAEAVGVRLTVAATAQEAVRGSDVVVPLTTVTKGYIRAEWLLPTATVVHVSLDDLLAEVVLGAAQVVVDDWQLVRTDPRRLLGRMYREGLLYGQDEPEPGQPAKRVDGTLGELLLKETPLADGDGVTVVNPFGMSVQDVALAHRVFTAATELGIGSRLPR